MANAASRVRTGTNPASISTAPISVLDERPLDERVVRTSELIDAAFVALLHRRSYEGIRVGDITRKAGVGRATFYAYYTTKHDLLQSQMHRIVGPMLGAGRRRSGLPHRCLGAVRARRRRAADLSRADHWQHGLLVQRLLLACLEERLRQLWPADVQPAHDVATPRTLAVHFVAASLLTVVGWVIEHATLHTPAELQTLYARLIGGAQPAATA